MKCETKLLRNKEMNKETYALRRKVIEIIYEMKKEVDLPRIEVRVTHKDSGGVQGVGRFNKNIIWITDECIGKSKTYLRHVVAHEIGHAVFGIDHSYSCKVMRPYLADKPATKKQVMTFLKKVSLKIESQVTA